MSKKPQRSGSKRGAKVSIGKAAAAATKRPAAASGHDREDRIVRALEAIAAGLAEGTTKASCADVLASADAFIWHPNGRLAPVPRVNRVELGLLKGIDRLRDILIENTERFANGYPANNALLWGARGMGKSSLVKASHSAINKSVARGKLKLVEIHREDI